MHSTSHKTWSRKTRLKESLKKYYLVLHNPNIKLLVTVNHDDSSIMLGRLFSNIFCLYDIFIKRLNVCLLYFVKLTQTLKDKMENVIEYKFLSFTTESQLNWGFNFDQAIFRHDYALI